MSCLGKYKFKADFRNQSKSHELAFVFLWNASVQ